MWLWGRYVRGQVVKKLLSGKVRDVYEVSPDRLVIVTTDRVSAFDVILNKPVPGKGKILNAVSLFWFNFTRDIAPNHIMPDTLPEYFRKDEFEGRTVLVKKLKILPFEFVVRGYIFGNMWEAYARNQEFCGQKINGNYKLAQKLATPLFTVSTKAHVGHDEYVSWQKVVDTIGGELADGIKNISIKLYEHCYDYAYQKGLVIADTKFEFGLDENGKLVLADEIFTPDSARFWDLREYEVGKSPKSYDKQFLRDWLLNNKVDGEMRFDDVPDDVLKKTADMYRECLEKITGQGTKGD